MNIAQNTKKRSEKKHLKDIKIFLKREKTEDKKGPREISKFY